MVTLTSVPGEFNALKRRMECVEEGVADLEAGGKLGGQQGISLW